VERLTMAIRLPQHHGAYQGHRTDLHFLVAPTRPSDRLACTPAL